MLDQESYSLFKTQPRERNLFVKGTKNNTTTIIRTGLLQKKKALTSQFSFET